MTSISLCRRWLAFACVALLACGAGDSGASSSSSAAPPAAPLESSTAAASVPAATASAVAADPSLSRRGIRWTLKCTPARVTMATRNQLKVEIAASNESNETRDTELRQVSFTTDGGGRPSRFFGNGHHDKLWSALPPGETMSESYMMGESLLKKTGDLSIAIVNDGAKASCSVHVDP